MSEKREFPILNGKLLSDLDANGHKIIGGDIEVPPEKIKEAVAPELEAKADTSALEAEAQRATEAEAALGEAIAGKVDAEKGKGLSSNDYTNEEKAKLGKAYSPDNPPPTPDMSDYAKKSDVEAAVADKAFIYEVEEAKQVAGEAQVRAEAAENLALKVEEDVKAALPRYLLTTMSPTSEGHLIIDPFYLTLCQFGSELPETLTIGLMDGEDYGNPHTYAREYILVVDLVGYYSSPRIEWGGMRPRTDAETDFACVAGVRNVYWISEYSQGEFVVAGWQETEGGNAE